METRVRGHAEGDGGGEEEDWNAPVATERHPKQNEGQVQHLNHSPERLPAALRRR